jgi:hypothetical protein
VAGARTVSRNIECVQCGVTAADLPYEQLDMTLTEACESFFNNDGDGPTCQWCT